MFSFIFISRFSYKNFTLATELWISLSMNEVISMYTIEDLDIFNRVTKVIVDTNAYYKVSFDSLGMTRITFIIWNWMD